MSSSTPTVADCTQLISELHSGANFLSGQQRAHAEKAVNFLLEQVRIGSASGALDVGVELPKWISAYTALPTSEAPIIGVRLDDGAVRIAWVGRWRGGVALRVHQKRGKPGPSGPGGIARGAREYTAFPLSNPVPLKRLLRHATDLYLELR